MDKATLDKQQQEQLFNDTADALIEDEKSEKYIDWASPIGLKLKGMFKDSERDRRPLEMRWLKDLRQYKGEYDPEVAERIHPKRSKAFIRTTRTKVKTLNARLVDLLFPGNEEKNWGIGPTPIPDMDPKLTQQIADQFTQIVGQKPTNTQLLSMLNEEAQRRCAKMETSIEDQLEEIKYRDVLKDVIHSGNLYGTGVMKGPLVRDKIVKRWVMQSDGTWQTIQIKSTAPYIEFVSLWDFYPDLSSTTMDNTKYIFQRHVMIKKKLQDLQRREDFNEEAIEEFVNQHPEGNSQYMYHEQQLAQYSDGQNSFLRRGRNNTYDVMEFWGYLTAEEITEIPGFEIEIDDEMKDTQIPCNIWFCDNIIIKATISPLEGTSWPYYAYYFDKDETSFFGEGVASIMRDPQTLTNASVRAMLDNAAISAGPIIEANLDLLPENEDPTDLYPFRVFTRTGSGVEAASPAFRVSTLPSYTAEFMKMLDLFMTLSDEVTTVPRYMQGDSSPNKAIQRTAAGLSMMMGAANITLKDQVKNFDDGITKPFITAMYFWNMEFNPDPDTKGDYEVDAKGVSSLIAKEVRAENLIQFLNITNNPGDLGLCKRVELLREVAQALDLHEDRFIKTDDELQMEQEQGIRMQQMAQQGQQEQQNHILEMKALAGGHLRDVPQQQDGVPPDQAANNPGSVHPMIQQPGQPGTPDALRTPDALPQPKLLFKRV